MSSPRDRGRPPHPDVLTPGEWRVAEAVRHGLGNREIATRQGVSIDAVKLGQVARTVDDIAATRWRRAACASRTRRT
jgi:DNA-binding NarL/FixJ family response regulator